MAQIIYDEKGNTFLYFLVSFFGMILIPISYWFWPKGLTEEQKRLQGLRNIHAKSKWYKKTLEALQKKRRKPNYQKIFLILAWIVFAILAYRVSMIERDFVEYDPYEVLGVSVDASNATIKKAYRQLSKENHPDKGGTPELFMRIRKAYEALTDEETRKNWEEHGNPDGPQAMEFGIALPSWIVDSQNSVFVLGLYVLAFMIILPVIVGVWWNRSIKYSKEKVLLNTTQLYYHFFNRTPNMNRKRALTIFSSSFEFSRNYNPEIRAATPADNVEVPELIRELGTPFDPKGREAPLNLPYSVKARTLIYCHLARRVTPSEPLEADLDYILRKTPILVQEMVNCLIQLTAYAHYDRAKLPMLETVETVMKLSPTMVQGLKESKSPLLQLPYFSDEYVRFCSTKRIAARNLRSLAKINDADRRQMLRRMGDEEYETMVSCLKSMPMIDLEADIKVLDDEEAHIITAGAIVTVTVHLTRKTLGDIQEDAPKLSSLSGAGERGDVEDQEQNHTASKTKVWEKNKKKKGAKKKPKKPAAKKQAQNQQQNQQAGSDTTGTERSGVEEVAEQDPDRQERDEDEESNLSDSDQSDTPATDQTVDEDAEWEAMQQTFRKKHKKIADLGDKMTHTVYAPNFPIEKQEWWWVYVCSRKRHLLLTVPVQVCNLVDHQELDLKFPAPQNTGRYTYDVWVRSDAYLDCDAKQELKFNVEEARKVEEDHPQWQMDESEEEEEDAVVEESEDEGISTDDSSD